MWHIIFVTNGMDASTSSKGNSIRVTTSSTSFRCVATNTAVSTAIVCGTNILLVLW